MESVCQTESNCSDDFLRKPTTAKSTRKWQTADHKNNVLLTPNGGEGSHPQSGGHNGRSIQGHPSP